MGASPFPGGGDNTHCINGHYIANASETRIDSDAEGIAALLKAHEEAVALFHQEAIRGMDPAVKSFAQATLPTLQRRLEALQLLQISFPEKAADG